MEVLAINSDSPNCFCKNIVSMHSFPLKDLTTWPLGRSLTSQENTSKRPGLLTHRTYRAKDTPGTNTKALFVFFSKALFNTSSMMIEAVCTQGLRVN
jgi:hypothetical protein